MEDNSIDSDIVKKSVGLSIIDILRYKSIGIFQYFQSFKRGRNVHWINDDIENDRMYGSYTNGRTVFHAVVSFKPMIVQDCTFLCFSCIGVVPHNAGGLVALFRHIREIPEFHTSVDYMTLETSESENDEEYDTLLKNGWTKKNCIESTTTVYTSLSSP